MTFNDQIITINGIDYLADYWPVLDNKQGQGYNLSLISNKTGRALKQSRPATWTGERWILGGWARI